MKKSWYILAYDIADPRRLRRVLRHIRKSAIPLQQSVHAVYSAEPALGKLLEELENLMDRREDDLRAWPIPHPGDLWYVGNFHWEGKLRTDSAHVRKSGLRDRVKQLFRPRGEDT